ncbi:MAG: ribonuclease Z [Myxococcota bacterium]|jgi:ribonuclease Z
MSARELHVLGTASQVPTRYRNHNGYFLRWDQWGILFDPGEGTQRQLIYSNLSANQINRICITHFHGDHCLGLAGIVQRISLDEVPHPVHVHYPASGQKFFDRLRHASIFYDRSDIRPVPTQEAGIIGEEKEFRLETRRLIHGAESWGYRLVEPDGRRMLPDKLDEAGIRGRDIGNLVRDGFLKVGERVVTLDEVSELRRGQVFAFVMDTRLCDAAFELAQGADLLVCESTYLSSEEREAHDHGHMTAAQAARVAAESGARRLVLTHFSQRYPDTNAFLEEARPIHEDVIAVRDGDVVPVPRRR